MGRARKEVVDWSAMPRLDPLYYNEDREMISHKLVPMDQPSEGVFWCRVCGGHPTDPIHQPGYEPD